MANIVFLHDFPEAAEFCWDYIGKAWNLEKEAVSLVQACMFDNKGLPFVLVARENGLPVGMVLVTGDNEEVSMRHSPWLLALYVREESRRKGIGTALVERACSELKKQGYSEVYIDTVRAADFYRKKRWDFIEDARWNGKTTAIFRKVL